MREATVRRGTLPGLRVVGLGLWLAAGVAVPARAAADFPTPWSAVQVDSLRTAHRGDHAFTLLRRNQLDLKFDPGSRSLRGQWAQFDEFLILDTTLLAEIGMVSVERGPHLKLEDFRVTVLPRDGGKPRKLEEGELDWATFAAGAERIVMLDEEISLAAVPGLRAGDRLQIAKRYALTSHHGIPPLNFGGLPAAVATSRSEISLPPHYRLTWSVAGDSGLSARLRAWSDSTAEGTTWNWRLDDVPVPTEDPTGRSDDSGQVTLLAHVASTGKPLPEGTFAVGADWASVARGCRERIDDRFAITPDITGLARRLTAACVTDRERIAAVYAHVQSSTRYLAIYRGLGGIIPEPAADVLADGYGDCKGLGALLIALLRAVDIDAWPVLVRTAFRGPLFADVPNPIQFDHFIVWADDGAGGLWLDATLEGCPAGYIHPQDAASPVLSLRPGAEGLCEIPHAAWGVGVDHYDLEGTLSVGGVLDLQVGLEASGISGVMLKGRCLHLSAAELAEQRRLRLLPTSTPLAATANVGDLGEVEGDRVSWWLSASSTRPLKVSGATMFLPRVLPPLPFPTERLEPGTLADRVESWSIALPDGWTVEPDSVGAVTPTLAWSRRTWQEGGRLRLQREIRWDRGAARALSPGGRRELWEGIIRRVREDSKGFIAIRTVE